MSAIGVDGASTIVVTPELQEVMREYTKAVMRDTPEDVLEYSQQWFLNKYTERRMAAYDLEASTSEVYATLSGDIQEQVEDLFKRFDTDSDSQLNVTELRVMVTQVELFSYFEEDTTTLLALMDMDGNESVSWQEFSAAIGQWLKDLGQ